MGLSARDLIEKTSSPERVFDICLNGRLRADRDLLQSELDEENERNSGKMAVGARAAELTEQLAALDEQIAEATVAFRFRGLSHWRVKEIQRRFPTEEAGAAWDVDAGAPTLISECLVDPKFSADEVRELLERGNQRLADEFITAALLVCQQGNEVPKSGRGSASTRRSGSK